MNKSLGMLYLFIQGLFTTYFFYYTIKLIFILIPDWDDKKVKFCCPFKIFTFY